MRPESSTLELFASLSAEQRARSLTALARKHGVSSDVLKARLLRDWRFVGRPKQQPPDGGWTFWFLRCGRGFGKTITAAQWIRSKAREPGRRIALVAPTMSDVRVTMCEGETGLLSILPRDLLRGGSRASAWNRGPCELYLANGTYFKGYSSEEPGRLRGPQHHYAWGEEVSSWDDARQGDVLETTWSNLKLGCRLGDFPQIVLTSTPRPNKLTKDLLAIDEPRMRIVVGSSYENRANLSEAWWSQVVAPYEGTRTGRQEIHAELLEDVEGALWTKGQIDALRIEEAPPLSRVVVAVDPNVSSSEAANDAGIVVAGRGQRDRYGYVLADRTVTRGGPRAWAQAAVDAYHDWSADRIVAEKNNGGEMVGLTIKTVDATVPVKLVSASRGKRTRAEPIAAYYEGSDSAEPQVRHVGAFPELEDEMTTWTPEAESPNRMDALVWALSELLLTGGSGRYTSMVARGASLPTGADRRGTVGL